MPVNAVGKNSSSTDIGHCRPPTCQYPTQTPEGYGTAGPSGSGSAFVTPRLFISQFGDTLPPFQQVAGTDLGFQYSLEGLGTPNLLLHYVLRNNSSADNFTDLRFIVNVEPSGAAEDWTVRA